MDTKVCCNAKCAHQGEPQPVTNFSRNPSRADGMNAWCKDCLRIANAAYRAKPEGRATLNNYNHSEKGKATRKRGERSEKGKIAKKRYQQSEKGKAVVRRQYDKNKNDPAFLQKQMAHLKVEQAIIQGKLPRASSNVCTYCPKPAAHYHHYLGYEEEHWLDVEPVCVSCHHKADRAQAR